MSLFTNKNNEASVKILKLKKLKNLKKLKDSVRDALIVIVLLRAPVIDGDIDELMYLFDTGIVRQAPEKPLLELRNDGGAALARKAGQPTIQHLHLNYRTYPLHMPPRFQKTADQQCAEILILLAGFTVHDVEEFLCEFEGRSFEVNASRTIR